MSGFYCPIPDLPAHFLARDWSEQQGGESTDQHSPKEANAKPKK